MAGASTFAFGISATTGGFISTIAGGSAAFGTSEAFGCSATGLGGGKEDRFEAVHFLSGDRQQASN